MSVLFRGVLVQNWQNGLFLDGGKLLLFQRIIVKKDVFDGDLSWIMNQVKLFPSSQEISIKNG